jgi:hypothetical protein
MDVANKLLQLNTNLGTINTEVSNQAELISLVKEAVEWLPDKQSELLPSAEELTIFDQEEYRIKGETLALIAQNIEEYSEQQPNYVYGKMTPRDMSTAIATVYDSGYTAGYEEGLALDNLYGTTWKLNDKVNTLSENVSYNLEFISAGKKYQTFKFKNNWLYYDNTGIISASYTTFPTGAQFITILTGADATNTDLIKYFRENGELLSIGNIAGYSNNNVSEISAYCFGYDSHLVAIDYPYLSKIGEGAFFQNSNLINVIFPITLSTIGKEAFYSCSSLETIHIPTSVTSIGEGAFRSCRSLKQITYAGTQDQWNKVTKGTNWAYGTATTAVTCLNGGVAI